VKRINKDTATDCLLEAMEHADEMQHVIVIYETKEGNNNTHGAIVTKDSTLAQLGFLLDVTKSWLISMCSVSDDDA
jgi:hypothetical protein